MAKAAPLQPSFSAGEFSPRIYGRVDSERYKTGLETCLNYVPTTQGPLVPRSGFKYVGNNVKDPSKPPTLIPFQFSQKQNYIIEAGERYMRFYTNNGQILTSGTSFVVYGYGYQNNKSLGYPGHSWWPIYGTRANTNPNANEIILTGSTSVSSFGGQQIVGTSPFVAAGTVLELPTPYIGSSYLELKWAQRQDALYLFHKDYPVYKLIRSGGAYWDLKAVRTSDGPYLPQNTYALTGDSLRIKLSQAANLDVISTFDSAGGVVVAGTAAGTSNMIVIQTATPHPFQTGDKIAVIGILGTTEANTSGFNNWTVQYSGSSKIALLGSQFVNPYGGSSGQILAALFTQTMGVTSVEFTTAVGGKVWGHIQPTTAYSADYVPDITTPTMSSVSTVWRLGAWSTLNGYPSAGCFHQQRLAVGGVPNLPQRIDLSVSGEYENFAPHNSSFIVADNNAISFNLDHVELNKINWLKSDDKGLLVGTFSSEFQVTPNNQAAALSPTNVNAKETSAFGSYDADALKVGNATIYIQRAQKDIRELNYFFQVDTYRSTDITEISEHITAPSIFKIVSQKETIPIVWTLRTDGTLLSMCYSRDDVSLQVGWSRHRLGGQFDSGGSAPQVKSMAVIPDPTGLFDQLWITARRYINGTSVVSVEYMSEPLEQDTQQEDFFYSDMGATLDNPVIVTNITTAGSAVLTAANHGFSNNDEIQIVKVVGMNSSVTDVAGVIHASNLVNYRQFVVGSASTNAFFLKDFAGNYVDSRAYSPYFSDGEVRKRVLTISGLSWLKNETVSILADGKVHPQTLVNSGGILTLQYRAAKVQIGLPYNMDGKTLRPDAGAQDGTSIGKKRRTSRVALMLNQAYGISIGPAFDRLTPLNLPGPIPAADSAAPLFGGIVRDTLEGEFNFEGQVCFRQSSPTGGMVQTVTKFIEENDA